jgi:hypothetical protein
MATTKPADANKDGKVTAKEQAAYDKKKAAAKPGSDRASGDTLSKQALEARYNFAYDVITKNPELLALWKKATNAKQGYWTAEEFQSQLRNTKWYQNNAEYTRKAWTAEQLGGADWQAQLEEAGLAVQKAATAMGAKVSPEQMSALTRDYIYKGWGTPGREAMLEKALAASITLDDSFMSGQAGSFQQRMLEISRKNGLKFSNDYYQAAARSVASGLTTEEDWLRQQREAAASQWPMWSDKIMSGLDMEQLASGYKNIMASVFEIDPEAIDLSDPYMKQALTAVDEQGNPKPVGLWDFEQQLKNDPRWLKTKQATNDIASVGMDVLRAFGMVG